jgi:hypothetical protein
VQSWLGYILTLLLVVVGVHLMTDVDYFHKQTQELKKIKEEFVQRHNVLYVSLQQVRQLFVNALESTSTGH